MNIQDYIDTIPRDKKEAFLKLRETVVNHIPEGFEEGMSYNMIGFVVPHRISLSEFLPTKTVCCGIG